jgi:hypothetical protein
MAVYLDMVHQVQTYADLRKQIRKDLRAQNPEWVQPNGESPMCDSYEARLIELLKRLNAGEPNSSSRALATSVAAPH